MSTVKKWLRGVCEDKEYRDSAFSAKPLLVFYQYFQVRK